MTFWTTWMVAIVECDEKLLVTKGTAGQVTWPSSDVMMAMSIRLASRQPVFH
jgi:hypothetical protein